MNVSRVLTIGFVMVAFCFALVPAACADTITHNVSIPLATTNWNSSVTIPKFDMGPNCILDSVGFCLYGHVEGEAKFESLDASPATVMMNLQATISLQRPDNTVLATVIPLAQTSDDVTAYDGTTDFGGTSGITHGDLSGDKSETAVTSAPADLALFTGPGSIILPAVAIGTSNGSGAGNLLLQFNTSASVDVSIVYCYHCTSAVENTTWGAIKALYK